MDKKTDLRIRGGQTISGTIQTGTSKNGSLALLCAALLNSGTTTLYGIANIEEVSRLCEVLEALGVSITRSGDCVTITPAERIRLSGLTHPSLSRIRSGLMLIPALSQRLKSFALPSAGGCRMGRRTIAAHIHALADLGITLTQKEEALYVTREKTSEQNIVLYEASDTATINAILAAATLPQITYITFASSNYQVQEVCFFLESLGIIIDGIGTHTLRIEGQADICRDITYTNSEDPIEAMALIAIAATCGSSLKVTRVPIAFLTLELFVLRSMQLTVSVSEHYPALNKRTMLADVTIHMSSLTAPEEKVHAVPYPGINTDNLPFFAVIATQAKGETLIHDWMWEDRAPYFTNLTALGADITLLDQHRVTIRGKTPLTAAEILCPPALRPASILLVGMLAAVGTSLLRDTYVIHRGHEDIVNRLNAVGADISIVT